MTGQAIIDAAELSSAGHAYIRVRDQRWANPEAYLRLSVVDVNGTRAIGPWAQLYDRPSQVAIGESTPQVILTLLPPFNLPTFLKDDIDVWAGPLDPADT